MKTMMLQVCLLLIAAAATTVDAAVREIGTEKAFAEDATMSTTVMKPPATKGGDLLVLAIHRTDDYLPVEINQGWTRVAECFKTKNARDCAVVSDCNTFSRDSTGRYCEGFSAGNPETGGGPNTSGKGHDLAVVIYVKEAACNEPDSYSFRFKTKHTYKTKAAWFLLTALSGAQTTDPVRDHKAVGVDGFQQSRFPSVDGRRGEMLLLFQSFDDGANTGVDKDNFQAPEGFFGKMSTFGVNIGDDETAFTYGQVLDNDGPTGVRTTRGKGHKAASKDALVAMTIKAGNSLTVCSVSDNNNKPDTVPDDSDITSLCNPRSWGGVKKRCGGFECRALAKTSFASSCEDFCRAQGHECSGAYEDKKKLVHEVRQDRIVLNKLQESFSWHHRHGLRVQTPARCECESTDQGSTYTDHHGTREPLRF